jgi:hypothetical protein
MWYAQARYYAPKVGRFTSEDPWSGTQVVPNTMNPYPYVLNNPLKYVDPLGLAPGDYNVKEYLKTPNSNNPVNATTQQVTSKETSGADWSCRERQKVFKGAGAQAELSLSIGTVGLEIIWYNKDNMEAVEGVNYYEPVIYVYSGIDVGVNDQHMKVIQEGVQSFLKNLKESLNVKSQLGGSLSIVTVWGDDRFKTPDDYKGDFISKTIVVKNAKVSTAVDPDGKVRTFSAGVSSSVFSISSGASYYWRLDEVAEEMNLDWLKDYTSQQISDTSRERKKEGKKHERAKR